MSNLIESNDGCADVFSTADPNLGPLADNGGPTETHALLPGSPAINTAHTQGAPAVDQRGVPRPQPRGGAADIGAFELQSDPAPPTLSINNQTVEEGDGDDAKDATFTVTLSRPVDGSVTANYAAGGGTATAGTDYGAVTDGQVTFQPGQTEQTITVKVNGDTTDEDDETFEVVLSNPQNATVSGGRGIGTINDNDEAPSLSVSDQTVTEGDPRSPDAAFTVTLSAASGRDVTVGYATNDVTATSGEDYDGSANGSVTVPAGQTTATIAVPIRDDDGDEWEETFEVNLSDPSNATVHDGQGIGTITDDDTAGITVEPTGGLTTSEAGATATFTVVLNTKPTGDVAIGLTSSDTSEGTVSPASLTFTPDDYDDPQTVTVTGVDDADDDGDVAYKIVTGAATSADEKYYELNADDVSVTNADDDEPRDTTPPDTVVTAGPSGAVKSASASFRFSSTESGSSFECSLDGAAFRECSSPKSYSNLKDGEHTFRVRATDAAGNADPAPARRTWTVDTNKPTITNTSSELRSRNGDRTLTVGVIVKDNVTNLREGDIKLYVNGKRIDEFSYSSRTDRLIYKLPRPSEGRKVFKVVATDAAGNVGAKSWDVTIG